MLFVWPFHIFRVATQTAVEMAANKKKAREEDDDSGGGNDGEGEGEAPPKQKKYVGDNDDTTFGLMSDKLIRMSAIVTVIGSIFRRL